MDRSRLLVEKHFRSVKQMGLVIEQPESLGGGGNFVDQIGVYHFLITDVDENPAKDDGSPLAGTRFSLSVLAGTRAEQVDRVFNLMLWNPKEKNDMASKRLTAFFLATMQIGNHTPGQRTTVEPSDAIGRQIVAKLAWKQEKNQVTGKYEDTDRVDLSYSDIWHVDDPAVAKNKCPLNADAIATIPPVLRKAVATSQPGGDQVKVSAAALVSGTRAGAAALGDV
jgi:hypothetical protein